MYKVYGMKGSGSAIVEALLELSQQPYKVVEVERDADGQFPATYAAINPLCQVPALVLPDGSIMTESGAITVYLADLHTGPRLAPATDHPQRGKYLRWMFYLAANIYMSDLRVYYPQRYVTDPGLADSVRLAAEERMAMEWNVLAEALGDGPFILGSKMSAADIYAAVLTTWNTDTRSFFRKHPNIRSLYDGVTANPVIAGVLARHDLII
jgi:glutathione S-transferase